MIQMYMYIKQRIGHEDGQTMAEYAVILGVITLLVVGALTGLSGAIQGAIDAIARAEVNLDSNVNVALTFQQLAVALRREFGNDLSVARASAR